MYNLTIKLGAFRLIKQVPDNFLLKKVLTLNMKRKRPNNKCISNDAKWINITLLRILLGIFLIHLHNFGCNIPHGAALIIDVVLVGFGSQTEITQNPLVLLLTIYYVFGFYVTMHYVVLVQISETAENVFYDFADELTRVHAFVFHHVLQGAAWQIFSY